MPVSNGQVGRLPTTVPVHAAKRPFAQGAIMGEDRRLHLLGSSQSETCIDNKHPRGGGVTVLSSFVGGSVVVASFSNYRVSGSILTLQWPELFLRILHLSRTKCRL